MLKNLGSHQTYSEENEQAVWCRGQQASAVPGFINRRIQKDVFIFIWY